MFNKTEYLTEVGLLGPFSPESFLGKYIHDFQGTLSVFDAATGYEPTSNTERFAVQYNDSGSTVGIVYCSDNPLDLLAFAIAARNVEIAADGDFDEIPDEYTFTEDGMRIHNPFAEPTYHDWDIEEAPIPAGMAFAGDLAVRESVNLDHYPSYTRWRDTFMPKMTEVVPSHKV